MAAVADNGVIGWRGKLPWCLPSEQQLFRRVTMGKPIVMGRKTYESIGRALDGRLNIVISGKRDYKAPGCVVVHSVGEALRVAEGAQEVMVIGGEAVYRAFLPLAERIYLTRVRTTPRGDAYFPHLDPADWVEVQCQRVEPDEQQSLAYSVHVLKRKRPAPKT